MEKENRNKFDFKDNNVESASSPSRSKAIDSFQRENNIQQKEEYLVSQDSARSNHQIVPNSPNQNNVANESLKRRISINKLSNSSDSDKEPLRNQSSSDSNAIDKKQFVSVPRPAVKTVRISSLVENIETKKSFPLENSVGSTLEADEVESDEEKKDPYELTKPQAKMFSMNNYEPPEFNRPSNQRKSSFGNEPNNPVPNYQPKVKA